MAAPVISIENYPQSNRKMKIPLQTEVAKYMEEKMGWSREFCLYYADKFWNHYQAQGWKLSNGNAMKDWKAAFNSQWQIPKFKEDIEKLNQTKKTENLLEMEQEAALNFLDKILMAYKGGLKPTRDDARKIYDYIKGIGLLSKLPPKKFEEAKILAGNNQDNRWMFELKAFMDLMIKHNYTFKQWFTKQ